MSSTTFTTLWLKFMQYYMIDHSSLLTSVTISIATHCTQFFSSVYIYNYMHFEFSRYLYAAMRVEYIRVGARAEPPIRAPA